MQAPTKETEVTTNEESSHTETPTLSQADKSKLKQKLDSLKAPFKSGSPFHLTVKRTSSLKSSEAERNNTKVRRKSKKNKPDVVTSAGSEGDTPGDVTPKEEKRSVAGAFVRRLGGMARGRRAESLEIPVGDEDTASQSSSAKELDTRSSTPPSQDPSLTDIVAAEHPVSTLPFAKSTWMKKRAEPEIILPIETASPDSVMKRRIAFVEQASSYLSVDQGGGDRSGVEGCSGVGVVGRPVTPQSLEEVVGADTDSESEHEMPAYGDLLETPEAVTSQSVSTRSA